MKCISIIIILLNFVFISIQYFQIKKKDNFIEVKNQELDWIIEERNEYEKLLKDNNISYNRRD